MASSNEPAWIFAGPASSFPNIEPSSTEDSSTSTTKSKTKLRPTPTTTTSDPETSTTPPPPPCKILQCPESDATEPQELTADEAQTTIGIKPQVLIFQYRNKFHALDHACPHRTYPLSRGSIHDIEDFGIVLSAGITCPGHGWAFDLFTGESDRGNYRLGLWDVEVRQSDGEEEVWVRKRRRKRMG